MSFIHKSLLAVAVGAASLSPSVFAQEATSVTEALKAGKTNLHLRARYETVEEEGLEDAAATTLKTRLTYNSGTYQGFGLTLEMDDTTELFDEDYSNGVEGKGTAAIVDPETTEVNQVYVSYSNWSSTFKYGRQRILLDNQRFVGGVGWRQDEQTFNSFSIASKPAEQLELFASYITHANRIFAEAQDHNHQTALLNGKYTTAFGTGVAYAYLIDNQTAAALSSDTFGLRWAGKAGEHLSYTLEYATQTEAGDATLEYSADYMLAELTGNIPVAENSITLKVGYELLGSDNGIKAFATPLATLHAFQGWTDRFLGTPANGIQDIYGSVGSQIDNVNLGLVYHSFEADNGNEKYGSEIGLVASTHAGPVGLTFKYADYSADGELIATNPYTKDTSKLWLMAAVAF